MKRVLFPKNLSEAMDVPNELEESYERLFPKIGRDFVTQADLLVILNRIAILIDPFNIHGVNNLNTTQATNKALEYKDNIENGLPIQYKDLISLDI